MTLSLVKYVSAPQYLGKLYYNKVVLSKNLSAMREMSLSVLIYTIDTYGS